MVMYIDQLFFLKEKFSPIRTHETHFYFIFFIFWKNAPLAFPISFARRMVDHMYLPFCPLN